MKKKDLPDEEYEDATSEPRNWKGIAIALLVIAGICGVITLAIYFVSRHLVSEPSREKLQLHEVLGHPEYLNHNSSNATWVSNSEILYRDVDGTILLYDIATDWKTVLASNFSLARFQVESYTLSADHRYFLLVHDISSQRSFSTTAKYKIYDTKNSFISSLNTTDGSEVQLAIWGPKTSQLLVVSGNNLHYTSRYGVPFVQLTQSGRPGIIYNGIPDLVSEEFVLKKDRAIWWHTGGDKLAYASYDNSYVDPMPVVMYASILPEGSDPEEIEEYYDMYPRVLNHPYPKPGRRISFTTLYVTDLSSAPLMSRIVTPPKEIQSAEHYLIDVTWIDDRTLAVLWSRRSYNRTILSVCREDDLWKCDKVLDEHLPSPKGWLSIDQAPIFTPYYYFIKMPVADGSNGYFDHVVMVYLSGAKKHFLTHGSIVVTKLIAYRADIHTLYYVATAEGDPGVRHVYSVVDMEGDASKRRQLTCLSCDLGPDCLYNDAKFNPSGEYFILECLGPGIPRTELRHANNTLIEVLNSGSKLKAWAEEKSLPVPKIYKVPLASGSTARLEVLLPSGVSELDVSHHYPLVLLIDGRPEVQSVNYQFKLNWGHYLASKREYVVAHVDVRGSRFQGEKWKHKIYHHLGQYETDDIISVIKWVRESLAYIDSDKIAIHGKGVGGYIALSILAKSSFIRCGAVLSPIFSWKNYAAPFVEKYMGFPTENNINYEKADITRNLDSIRSDQKQVLFVHGTADRLVSVQNTMLIMKALTSRGVSFKIQLYPDGDHSLYRERMHLHQVVEELFVGCFKIEDEEDEKYSDMPLNKVVKGGKKIFGVGDE